MPTAKNTKKEDAKPGRDRAQDRPLRDLATYPDPFRRSAEQFAHEVEDCLRPNSERHGDTDFLEWALRRYDNAKTGSGRPSDTLEYDPKGEDLTLDPNPVREPVKVVSDDSAAKD